MTVSQDHLETSPWQGHAGNGQGKFSGTHANDHALVQAARAGNGPALAALCSRHSRYLTAIAYRLLGHEAEIDDVLQETFIDALRGVRGLKEAGSFRSWLSAILVRRAQARLVERRKSRRLAQSIAVCAPHVSDPSLRMQIQGLYQALEELAPKLRVPWILRHIEGQAPDEVARLCAVSLATCKRRIAAASDRLERRLGKHAFDFARRPSVSQEGHA